MTIGVAPDGSLRVACHSGGPDWGSGPTGQGKLYRIKYSDPAHPQPAVIWANGPREVRVEFDRPVDPELLYATLLCWLPLPEAAAGAAAAAVQPLPGMPSPRPFEVRLAAVDGLDVATGLRHVGGQVDIAERVLRRFVENYRGGEPALAVSTPTSDDLARWRAACHSLRGACAAIGAVVMQREVTAFERTLATSDEVQLLAPQARRLHEALLRLVGRLAAALE